jgi:hypothetical protein
MGADDRSDAEAPGPRSSRQLDDSGRPTERTLDDDARTAERAALLRDLEAAREDLRVAEALVRELQKHIEGLLDDTRRALSSRAVIDQAKGIVMADRHISADDAFQHLVELSSALHLKLRDLARMLVDEASGQQDASD